ncbi:MAG: DUF4139 domain-containing protein [Planctomycetes bacterium]|nr:DUF4139 domain-containing protein [Planctomycetota bacterium]MCB9904603.1 DUF4139 domain-containing protein [Planctomycetota bacterium]
MILNVLTTLFAATAAAEAQPVPAPIADVTVHTDRARVTRRSAQLVADGLYRVDGLTGSLDRDSLRARVDGGHVLSVELRAHELAAPPSARLAAFDEEQRALDAARAVLADELETLNVLATGLARCAKSTDEERATAGDPAVWSAVQSFLREQGAHDAEARRALEERAAELDRQQADLDRRRGELRTDRFPTYDALVELDVPDAGAALELEYLVPASGWEPRYELRTAKDARSVQVAYRASVWQQSGEDWEGVQLALSTAQPQRGAAAPELATRWANTYPARDAYRGAENKRIKSETLGRERYLDAEASTAEEPALNPFAEVSAEGLSLRYELPSTDTVLSGAPPTSVLVATAELGIEPEYHCVPALDTTVWLRGRARNDSAYTLLPGSASVFFGEDHLGNAWLDTVRPGQEFTLHLGPDHALTVERRMVDEGTKDAGFFGSKSTWHREWSVRVSNHGAAIHDADGVAVVYVREALPRSTDDRVTVSLAEANLEPAAGAQWVADRKEQGIETWRLLVPLRGEAELRYELRIKHPEGGELQFR